MAARTIFVLLSLLGASALQLQPVTRAVTPLRVPAAPVCQFGGKPDTEQKGLSRDSEPEDFFKSDWGARGRRPAFSARCTSARSSCRATPLTSTGPPDPLSTPAHTTTRLSAFGYLLPPLLSKPPPRPTTTRRRPASRDHHGSHPISHPDR